MTQETAESDQIWSNTVPVVKDSNDIVTQQNSLWMISVWMPPFPYVTAVYIPKVNSYLALLILCNAFLYVYSADALKVRYHRDQLIGT